MVAQEDDSLPTVYTLCFHVCIKYVLFDEYKIAIVAIK
jgi:hypothetical protein